MGDLKENKTEKTIEVTATLILKQTIPISHEELPKKFVGISRTPLQNDLRNQRMRREERRMKIEARFFALADFFKHVYGFTDIPKKDIPIRHDGLNRPL